MALQEEFETEGNWLFRYRSHLPLIILGIGLGVYWMTFKEQGLFLTSILPYWKYYECFCLGLGMYDFILSMAKLHFFKRISGISIHFFKRIVGMWGKSPYLCRLKQFH